LPISRPELNEQAILRLVQSLRSRRMFSMTGAGLSAWAGYPVWAQLLARLEARVVEVRDREVNVDVIRNRYGHSPLVLAHKLGHELGNEFLPFLRAQFGPAGAGVLSPVLLQFASLPFQQHLTLNYDDSLERAHPNGLVACGSVTAANREELIEFLELSDDPGYGKKVLHCHGLHSDPLDGLILTETGYAAVYQDNPVLKSLYWSLLSTRRILYAGFGFTDKDFLNTVKAWQRDTRVRERHLRHFAIYGLRDDENDEAERARLSGEYRIDPIFYEVLTGHDHSGFVDIVSRLTQELGTFTPPRPALPGALHAEALDAGDAARIEELAVNMANRTGGGLPNV
jgi:hypothetical protein